MTGAPVVLHATTVAVKGRGLLIMGRSGAGKSGLALRLIALGAELVADDRTIVTLADGALVATCPEAIRGRIEARGVGLLRTPIVERAVLAAAVDLDRLETDRLPPRHQFTLLGRSLDLVLRAQNDHFAESLLLFLTGGRAD